MTTHYTPTADLYKGPWFPCSRQGYTVLADSLGSKNPSLSGPRLWTNLPSKTIQGATAPNNTAPRVTGTHKPSTMKRWVMQTPPPYRGGASQPWMTIRLQIKSVPFARCLGSSLGKGWGVCISGRSKITALSCGEGASWGGLGIWFKCFLYSSLWSYCGPCLCLCPTGMRPLVRPRTCSTD